MRNKQLSLFAALATSAVVGCSLWNGSLTIKGKKGSDTVTVHLTSGTNLDMKSVSSSNRIRMVITN